MAIKNHTYKTNFIAFFVNEQVRKYCRRHVVVSLNSLVPQPYLMIRYSIVSVDLSTLELAA